MPPMRFAPVRVTAHHTARVTARTTAFVAAAAGLAAVAMVLEPAAAHAADSSTSDRLAASADTYTNSARPADTFGSSTDLRVGSGATGTKIAYLRFSVPADEAARVTSARLVLPRTDHHLPSTTIAVSAASPSWSESSVTAKTAPATSGTLDKVSVGWGTTNVNLDVTSAVRNHSSVDLAVTSPVSTDVAIFSSREAANGGPSLVLTMSPKPTPKPACTVSAKLVSSCHVWLGDTPQAYTKTMLTPGASLAYDESKAGRKFDILHQYNVNGKLFPSTASIALADQGRLLSENWKPATDMTWAEVAAGKADQRIDAEAAYLKSNFDRPFFLTIYHEPEDNVDQTAGSGMTVANYVAMYRHVITRLRADGATKFVSVMNYMGYYRWDSWRDALYPGDDVVDWIAYDPYMYGPSGQNGHDFAALVDTPHGSSPGFYTWATKTHPSKPLMIAEWGAYDDTMGKNPDGQAQMFATVARDLPKFPALKALIYFTMEPGDVAAGAATAPWETASGLAAWRQLVSGGTFQTPSSLTFRNGSLVITG